MELKQILVVAGEPELFKIIRANNKGIVAEGIISKKTKQIFTFQRVNSLEDIAIYTENGETPLKEVFKIMYNSLNKQKAIDHKSSPEKLKEFFDKVFPNYDKQKFLDGAMKKVVKWYNMLIEANSMEELLAEKEPQQQIENSNEKE